MLLHVYVIGHEALQSTLLERMYTGGFNRDSERCTLLVDFSCKAEPLALESHGFRTEVYAY